MILSEENVTSAKSPDLAYKTLQFAECAANNSSINGKSTWMFEYRGREIFYTAKISIEVDTAKIQ